MIIESWQELDHIALCCVGLALSWRESKLREVAAVYLVIIGLFTIAADPPSTYGQAWFLVCSVIEIGIIACLFRINRWSAYWVMAISFINLAGHLARYNGAIGNSWYIPAIITGEYAQASAIIILSPPFVDWHRRRLARKKEYTWLARVPTSIG